jgi:HK97 family phage major capsid protein
LGKNPIKQKVLENITTPEQVLEKVNASIAEKTQGFAKSEDLAQMKEEIATAKELASKSKDYDDSAVKSAIAEMEGKLDALKEEPNAAQESKSLGDAIFNAYKNAKDAIIGMVEKGGLLKLDVKAAGTMTITNNYSGGTVGLSEMEPGITRIARRRPFMRQLVNSRGTTSKYVVYTEQKNADPGVAGMTAEGALKTQTDFDVVEKNCEVKKVTAFIKVSKEMIADVPFMQGEINGELMEIVELKLDSQILSGDGLGDNLEGILENALPFTPGVTFTGLVPSANQSDVLRIAIAQIANNNFAANYILLNPIDAASMDLTKDANGQYTYGMTITIDGTTRVKSVPVIENPGVTVGTYVVGDFTKSNLRIREDLNVQIGYVNDDFTKNLITVLAEMRACQYVKSNHYGAFVTGNFAADIALIGA